MVETTLTSNHITDFRVEKVMIARVSSGAIITCKYLSTSCDLPIRANGGTLPFQSKDGKTSTRLSVRPHAAVFSRCLPSGREKTPDLAAAKCLPFDALFRRGVLDTMVKYLDPTDCINLCTAARGYESVYANFHCFHFQSSLERYRVRDSHEVMIRDARRFKFSKFDFSHVHAEIPSAIVKGIFQSQLEKSTTGQSVGKALIREIDLRSVKASATLIETISLNFVVKRLSLSSTSDVYDTFFNVEGLEAFVANRSPLTRLRFLNPDLASTLR